MLSTGQEQLYNDVMQSAIKIIEEDGVSTGRASNVAMKLRKAANHPLLHRRLYPDQLPGSWQGDYGEPEYMSANEVS